MKPLILLLAALCVPCGDAQTAPAQGRPNVLWFVVDDMSANFSCYGGQLI